MAELSEEQQFKAMRVCELAYIDGQLADAVHSIGGSATSPMPFP
jgi:hypothetical protein